MSELLHYSFVFHPKIQWALARPLAIFFDRRG